MGVDLLVVREGIDDEAVSMLTDSGITAYRRFEREDMDLLSRITGATPIRKAEVLSADDIGATRRGQKRSSPKSSTHSLRA